MLSPEAGRRSGSAAGDFSGQVQAENRTRPDRSGQINWQQNLGHSGFWTLDFGDKFLRQAVSLTAIILGKKFKKSRKGEILKILPTKSSIN
jgi:hypothetical protein